MSEMCSIIRCLDLYGFYLMALVGYLKGVDADVLLLFVGQNSWTCSSLEEPDPLLKAHIVEHMS
jgi:hypothetical protein